MSDITQRIVASARSHVGTRFAHQGRRAASAEDRGGLDCLGLLVTVARDCRLMQYGHLLAECDETDYGHIPDGTRLRGALERYLQPVSMGQLSAGDVVLMRMDGNPQHLGIIADYHQSGNFSLIHAYAPARGVIEHRFDEQWQSAVVAAYRFRQG